MFDIEKAVQQHRNIELRLAHSVEWYWYPWEIDYYLKESYRWN